MHKDAKAYFDGKDAANKEYKDAVAALESDPKYLAPIGADRYGEKWAPVYTEYSNAERALDNARSVALRDAYGALAKSEHPLISWIGKTIGREYEHHVSTILPFIEEDGTYDLTKMEAKAHEQDWCSEWDNFVSRAKEDGVLNEGVVGEAEAELWRFVRRIVNGNLYDRHSTRFRQLLTAALEEAKNTPVPAVESETNSAPVNAA